MGFWGHNLLVAGSDGSRTASQLLEAIERLSVDGDVWMSSGALGRIGGSELVACSLERRGADDQVIAALSRAVGGAALISIRIGDSDVCDARLLRDGSVEAVAVIGHETWDYTWQAGPKPDSSLVNAEAWVDVLGYSVEELVEIVEGSYGFVEDGVSRLLGRLVDHPEVGSMTPAEYVGDAIYGIDERLPVPTWLHDVVGFAGSTPARAPGRPRLVFAQIVSGPPYVGAPTRTLALHVGVFNNGGAGRGLRTLVGGHAVESGFVSPISANLGPLGFGPELDESDHPLQTDRGVQFDWPDKELEAAIVDETPRRPKLERLVHGFRVVRDDRRGSCRVVAGTVVSRQRRAAVAGRSLGRCGRTLCAATGRCGGMATSSTASRRGDSTLPPSRERILPRPVPVVRLRAMHVLNRIESLLGARSSRRSGQ